MYDRMNPPRTTTKHKKHTTYYVHANANVNKRKTVNFCLPCKVQSAHVRHKEKIVVGRLQRRVFRVVFGSRDIAIGRIR